MRLRLFKLRVFDHHCHVVASHDHRGEPIDVPGVDLRGDDAAAAFDEAAPLLEMLRQRHGEGVLRAVSLHLERRRLLATFEPGAEDAKPEVMRIDGDSDNGSAFDEVLSLAAPVIHYLGGYAARRIEQRSEGRSHPAGHPPLATPPTLATLTAAELRRIRADTLRHYDSGAQSFWDGTRDHDVSQNISTLLRHLPAEGSHAILDLGCGPGRDLRTFRDLGHVPVGLDGADAFVQMAREHADCEVLHQSFLELDLPARRFDGIFANASLFHVPSQELPRVLGQLRDSLADGGILLCSNPHGPDREGWSGDRYCCFLEPDTFRDFMTHAGFRELEHYYRPPGQPRSRQPWFVSVWRHH